jgi:uncharacterized SAM-binding protein YcdF (DUF218 family)
MIKSLAKFIIIIFESLKSFFLSLVQFVAWCFKHKVSKFSFLFSVALVFSWVVGFFLFVGNIKISWEELVSENQEVMQRTDAIVTVTGGSERIRHALFLLDNDMADKLFISGVNKEVKLSELLTLHGYSKEKQQLLSSRIELGYSAEDTIQNAEEISSWVKKNGFKSLRLVTSNYHIRRAYLELHHELPNVKIISHGVVPINIRIDRWWNYPSTRSLLISEYNKFIAANIRIMLENIGL